MSLFTNLLSPGGYAGEAMKIDPGTTGLVRPRTFKETIQDQIATHKMKIADLEAVRDSMSPEVEKFVEALQRIS